MRLLFFILFWGLFSSKTVSQDLSGDWQGIVWQADTQDTFRYQMNIKQTDNAVYGQAISTSFNGKIEAAFEISGRFADGVLTFQEVKQIRPSAPQWCLKFARVQLKSGQLQGTWTATGCKDGAIILQRKGEQIEEQPFEYPGRWTGHLAQSDRPYGFFFEVNINADGTGTSHIISEGAGGEAIHQLSWRNTKNGLAFDEASVKIRTQADWKWCLKSAFLQLGRHLDNYELKGDWTGYIEEKTPASGACAPGTIYLSKTVETLLIKEKIAPQTDLYTAETNRTVRVDRVIKVQSDQIYIRVWDNGIVDGDVVTLFLNGRRVIKEYRVNKRKWSIPVSIIKGENLLILHAEDLGDISPNTVAVAIDDGVEEQVIVLSSNLEESGAILIQPFEF